jgi:hypothetical protein
MFVVPRFSFSRKYLSVCKGGVNRLTPTEPTGTGQSIGSHHVPAKDMYDHCDANIITLGTTKKSIR